MAGTTAYHRETCEVLAQGGSSQEIRALAAAIGKVFEWLDGSYSDRRRLFADLRRIKERLDTVATGADTGDCQAAAVGSELE
jgi:hypothetical protein